MRTKCRACPRIHRVSQVNPLIHFRLETYPPVVTNPDARTRTPSVSSMFALAPCQAAATARCASVAAPKRSRVIVVAKRGAVEARARGKTSKQVALSIVTSVTFAGALMFAPSLTQTAFAAAGACVTSCESECLKLAPGSGEYCASACADECVAMKEENGGEEVDSGAFGERQVKGDFENLLEKMLDSQKIFFVGPASDMKKQRQAGAE